MTFTIIVTNDGTADAEDVTLTDPIPAFLDIDDVNVSPSARAAVTIVGNTVTIDFGTLKPDETYTVTVVTTVNSLGTPPGGTNRATVATPSADSDPENNADATLITIVTAADELAPGTGFRRGDTTALPDQPLASRYTSHGELALDIPALGIEVPIVGVPITKDGWDVTWLGSHAGYLYGTAFPTWNGNSVITSHDTLPSGVAGPLRRLEELGWDDEVVVHFAGQRYVYSVRTTTALSASDPGIFRHEERPWVTLMTCGGYDDATGKYSYRIIVRAVLTSIEPDS